MQINKNEAIENGVFESIMQSMLMRFASIDAFHHLEMHSMKQKYIAIFSVDVTNYYGWKFYFSDNAKERVIIFLFICCRYLNASIKLMGPIDININ